MSAGDRLAFLQTVPLFAQMDAAELAEVDRDLKPRTYAAGQTVFYQGDAGTSLHIVKSGWVRIYVYTADGQEVGVVRCGRGDYFGEIAILDNAPRTAEARAKTDVYTLRLSKQAFSGLIERQPRLRTAIIRDLSKRFITIRSRLTTGAS